MSILHNLIEQMRARGSIKPAKEAPATITAHHQSTEAERHAGADSMLDYAEREEEKHGLDPV